MSDPRTFAQGIREGSVIGVAGILETLRQDALRSAAQSLTGPELLAFIDEVVEGIHDGLAASEVTE